MLIRKTVSMAICVIGITSVLVGCDAGSAVEEREQSHIERSESEIATVGGENMMNRNVTSLKLIEAYEILEQAEDYILYELPVTHDGMNIYGQLYLPRQDTDVHKIAIIGHGFSANYTTVAGYAEYLAGEGIAAYVFDFCGGSSGSKSDGSMKDMSVITEREDMEAVLDEIRQFDFVDTDNVFLMGESQGGMVAALLAAKRPEDVKALILFCPALVIPDHARGYYMDADHVPENPSALGGIVGRRYFVDVIDMDVYEEICGYEKEVLIIHGNRDGVVPVSYSEQAALEYASAELIILDGAGHRFSGAEAEDACKTVTEFINERSDIK